LLSLHTVRRHRYPYLLQTAGGGWDILFAFPGESHRLDAAQLHGASFLGLLDDCWRAHGRGRPRAPSEAERLPFTGGWFVYLGYELLHQLEPSVPAKTQLTEFPVACLTRIPAAILVDNRNRRTYFFADPGHEACLPAMERDAKRGAASKPSAIARASLEEEDEALFLDGVTRVKDYIREGDVFQVNLSRRWRARLDSPGGAAEVYRALRRHNPAPFAGIADFGRQQIVSSSPERLVRVRGGIIETRPIAGTHPRSPVPEQDEQLKRALLAHPKERAEHVMLVDLERNDLGRICLPGSVEVDELMAVRTYAHVHHIESNVRGRLDSDITPGRVMRALFPGGTITGCPKVRTMQIISELEPVPRLAYTGSMGYVNHDGDMDMNILIRSFMLDGDALSFNAGAGIVADSVPQRELHETRAKAKGLLRALGL
jgi:anthranilate synthase component 1